MACSAEAGAIKLFQDQGRASTVLRPGNSLYRCKPILVSATRLLRDST
jgi:hypothetical protein